MVSDMMILSFFVLLYLLLDLFKMVIKHCFVRSFDFRLSFEGKYRKNVEKDPEFSISFNP